MRKIFVHAPIFVSKKPRPYGVEIIIEIPVDFSEAQFPKGTGIELCYYFRFFKMASPTDILFLNGFN